MWIIPVLRLSRRGLLRSKGRSALTLVMIGLPICLITCLLTLLATLTVTREETLPATFGAADFLLSSPVAQALPLSTGTVEVRLDEGFQRVHTMEVDLGAPLALGMRDLVDGRLPRAADEVVVTERLADLSRVVTRPARGDLRVVGVIRHPNLPNRLEIVGLPGAPLLEGHTRWLARGPVATVKVDAWREERGLYMVADITDPRQVITVGSVSVMAVLLTILTAGPAFAVGLRRRRDELTVVVAQGGSRSHVRLLALADGLVLGGIAAPASALLGVGAGLAGAPYAARWVGRIGPPEVAWTEVLWLVALGLVSAVVAAMLPVLPRPSARRRPWLAWAGVALMGAGVAVTVLALRLAWSWDWFQWILLSAVLIQLGLVAVTPWLVGVSERLAVRSPLPLRLAVRDAVRHRVRTACAVAAVSAATASVVAIGVGITSNQQHYRDTYAPSLPVGTMSISGRGLDDAGWVRLRAAAAAALSGAPLVAAREATRRDGLSAILTLGTLTCVDRCRSFNQDELPIGDGRLLAVVQGRQDPVAAAALASGKAVVFDARAVRDGKVEVLYQRKGTYTHILLPAVVAVTANPRQGGAVLPAAPLEAAGLITAERRLYTSGTASQAEAARLQLDLRAVAGRAKVRVEVGFQPEGTGYLWLILAVGAVLVLGATFAATGLAAADLRPDLGTMAAVGARRVTMRLVVAAQAGYIAGLGALVGAAAGLANGAAMAWPLTEWEPRGVSVDTSKPPFTEPAWPPTVGVPWLLLVALTVGLPLVAALVSGSFAGTRFPLMRRRT